MFACHKYMVHKSLCSGILPLRLISIYESNVFNFLAWNINTNDYNYNM